MAQTYNASGQFLEETSGIEHNINTIQKNIESIQTLQSVVLLSTSAQQEDVNIQKREKLMSSTKNLLIETKDRIKKIEYENVKLPKDDPNINLRKQRFQFLKEKFTNVLDNYRDVENTYMRQQKDRMTRQYRVVKPHATQNEIESYLNNPSSQPLFQQAVTTGEARAAFAEVQKRHGDIKQIEKTIEELADLFREMQLQVEEQDTMILNIEESVGDTLEKTKQSEGFLEKARETSSPSAVTVTASPSALFPSTP
nr:3648_t:CDS:2 [Entrophospora candida]CAG8456503.1 7460_t:CDS:2 [Entrophospora candida]